MRAQVKKWRESRAKLVGEAREHFAAMNDADKPEADKAAAEASWTKAMDDADKLLAKIEQGERQLAADEEQSGALEQRAAARGLDPDQVRAEDSAHAEMFRTFVAHGYNALTEEQRELFRASRTNLPQAAQSTADAAGGITIPETTLARVEKALKQFGAVRRAATLLSTASGEALVMPTNNDTGNVGELIGENTAAAEQDTVFASKTLNAYIYSSKLIKVSIPLIQDSLIDFEGYIAGILGERIGRIQNQHFTTADGVNKPFGIVPAAAAGPNAGAAAALSYADLVELEHSVDAAYRETGMCKFMLGDTALKLIKKLVDGEGRPLWVPGVATAAPDHILGYGYEVNVDMAAPATTVRSVLFGVLSKYHVREIRQVVMMVLRERFAEAYQVGLVGFHRADGELLDAGTGPIKALVHP